MTTKFVGIKEFRQNISQFAVKAKKENIKFIVLKKNVPILEISPIDEKNYTYIKLSEELRESEKQIEAGEFYTQEEVMSEFDLV